MLLWKKKSIKKNTHKRIPLIQRTQDRQDWLHYLKSCLIISIIAQFYQQITSHLDLGS